MKTDAIPAPRRWIIPAALVAGVMIGAVGCSGPRNYECGLSISPADEDAARAIWRCNRKIVVRALRSRRFSIRELKGAIEFFSRLTGIPAETISSRYGPLPSAELERALAAWDEWYRVNRESIIQSEEQGRLVASPSTVSGR